MSISFIAGTLRNTLELPAFLPGWVWLAGAGPGDPGLLTIHALNALQQADVVIHDALVDEAVLKLARASACVEYAGKRGGKPSPKQRDISLRLIELAKAGKRVLRLKGGDPFLFGRGGEEALALVEAKVPFRVIPGISAGVGGLAYAGIPVTHRDINHAVTFVTGHNAQGEPPGDLNWAALAQGSPVLVIYMGLKHLPSISSQLIASGRDPAEPVAIVSNATTSRQRVIETTLATAASDAHDNAIVAPALIVIGEVVRLRSGLDWLSAIAGKELVSDPLGVKSAKRETA